MFKKLFVAVVAIASFQAGAVVKFDLSGLHKLNAKILAEASESVLPFKVGDKADYSLNLAGFLQGTMNMLVREETAEGVWLEQNIDLQIQKQKVETLFDKSTGQVKKVLVDGQEQKLEPGEAPEIIESRPDTVTVPAGTFECAYVKLRDKTQNTETELWVNPEVIAIMGMAKMVAQTEIGPLTLELASFLKQ